MSLASLAHAAQGAGVGDRAAPKSPDSLPPAWRDEAQDCFKGLGQQIYGFVLRFAQGDHELALVVVQETFKEASVKRNWGQLRTRTEEGRKAWLLRVATNRAISAFRRTDTEREKWPLVCAGYEPHERGADEEAIANIAAEQLVRIIYKMPPQQARVAFLYWRCGWSVSQIARKLGITPGRVSQHKAKAEEKLKRELGPHMIFDFSEPKEGGDDEK
jgi:RNA polymerase sigma factor (sigma-70 family)